MQLLCSTFIKIYTNFTDISGKFSVYLGEEYVDWSNACSYIQDIRFKKQEQLKSKILTENCKRNLELVRLCYKFLVQPSFSLKQFWQQKENALLSLQIHQQFLLLEACVYSLRTEKDFKDFFKKEGYIRGCCFL